MKKLTLIFTAIIILIMSACAPSQNKEGESFFAMDTYMQAEVYGDRQTVNDIKAEIESLDKKLSSVNPESEIYKLNKSGSLELDGESAELIKRSVELCGFTDGNLDITVYPVVEKWGFIDKNYKIPTQSELDSLLKNVDYKKITVNGDTAVVPNGMKLDLGAVARGYAADKSREILSKSGVKSAILNLGGTVLAYGKKPNGENWKVGITDPENNENYMGVLECADKTVVTSGNYERYFESGGKRSCNSSFIINIDLLCCRHLGKSRHGHDGSCLGYDEPRAGIHLHLGDGNLARRHKKRRVLNRPVRNGRSKCVGVY